jgi:hypothetical protein
MDALPGMSGSPMVGMAFHDRIGMAPLVAGRQEMKTVDSSMAHAATRAQLLLIIIDSRGGEGTTKSVSAG